MSVSGRSGERSDLIPRRHVSRTGGLAGGPVRLGDPNRGLSAENFRNTTSCGRFDGRSGMAGTFRQETSGRRSHTTPAGGSRHLRVRVTIAQSVRVHRLAAPTAGPLAQPQLVGRSRRAPHAVRPNEPPSHPGAQPGRCARTSCRIAGEGRRTAAAAAQEDQALQGRCRAAAEGQGRPRGHQEDARKAGHRLRRPRHAAPVLMACNPADPEIFAAVFQL